MFNLLNKKNKNNDESSSISKDDLNFGFEFINFLLNKGINPVSLIGNSDLSNKYLEEYKNERVG